jgi:predicted heme/steroid binding protein
MRVFTLKELEEFDGREGRPAYVGLDGKVYDLTSSSLWMDGVHDPCPDGFAGQDLTELMDEAPPDHRLEMESFPVVGTLE